MAKTEATYQIAGVTDESGQPGTLTITQVKGGPDKLEFEPDAQAPDSEGEPIAPDQSLPGEQPRPDQTLPPSSEKVDEAT